MGARAARESAELLEDQNRILELIAGGAPLREILDTLLRTIQAHCPAGESTKPYPSVCGRVDCCLE